MYNLVHWCQTSTVTHFNHFMVSVYNIGLLVEGMHTVATDELCIVCFGCLGSSVCTGKRDTECVRSGTDVVP